LKIVGREGKEGREGVKRKGKKKEEWEGEVRVRGG